MFTSRSVSTGAGDHSILYTMFNFKGQLWKWIDQHLFHRETFKVDKENRRKFQNSHLFRPCRIKV